MDLTACFPSPPLLPFCNPLSACAGDTIANLSLARDGFPTMALTACFSSPLFVLLGGLTCTLVIFASECAYVRIT